jgi:hypothetical protein
MLREIRSLDLAALGAELRKQGEAILVARRRNDAHAGVGRHLERRLAERRRRAADDEQLALLDFQITEQAGPGGGKGFGDRSELPHGRSASMSATFDTGARVYSA